MSDYWQEISALTMRWVRRLSREKFSMLFTLVQPMLFWLIFFGNLFQRVADGQVTQAPDYISFLTAGVVIMTVLNNGLAGGVDLLFDKENGFLERLMTTPIHRTSVILSRLAPGARDHRGGLSIRRPAGDGAPRYCCDLDDRDALWRRSHRDFHGDGLFREESRRLLFGPGIPVPPNDLLELSSSALSGNACLDGVSRAVQSDDLGDRRGAAVDPVRLD